MKWDNDPLKSDKYLVFDGITKFLKIYGGRKNSEISIHTVSEFVDKFFDYQKLENKDS